MVDTSGNIFTRLTINSFYDSGWIAGLTVANGSWKATTSAIGLSLVGNVSCSANWPLN